MNYSSPMPAEQIVSTMFLMQWTSFRTLFGAREWKRFLLLKRHAKENGNTLDIVAWPDGTAAFLEHPESQKSITPEAAIACYYDAYDRYNDMFSSEDRDDES